MSNTIPIPPAALEAGARAMYADWIQGCLDDDDTTRATDYQTWNALDDAEQTHYLSQARAAFVAMVEAWPNGNLHVPVGAGQPRKSFTLPALILPLTEKQDDKA